MREEPTQTPVPTSLQKQGVVVEEVQVDQVGEPRHGRNWEVEETRHQAPYLREREIHNCSFNRS